MNVSKRGRGKGIRCWKIVKRGRCNFTTDAPIETLSVAGTFFVTGLITCLGRCDASLSFSPNLFFSFFLSLSPIFYVTLPLFFSLSLILYVSASCPKSYFIAMMNKKQVARRDESTKKFSNSLIASILSSSFSLPILMIFSSGKVLLLFSSYTYDFLFRESSSFLFLHL